ncbi:MAG: tetratricopeptide repeat protein [Candidatus Aminicenantes bacterium]|nr:MAG: tetratricopeptide repeat protein [Candidatus Aminicenantes bacterium]
MWFVVKRHPFVWSMIFFSAFFVLPLDNLAQQTVVEGVVVDREENPLKNVKITFTDRDRGTKFTLKSNKQGKFMKVGIPPSLYVISVQLEGYFALESEFKVDFGRNSGVKLVMEKIPPKIERDPNLTEGAQLFQQGKYEEATALFQKAIEKDPDNVDAHYNLALSLLRSGKQEEAIALLEKVKEMKPDMVETYLALGECYFNKSENDKAVSYFEKALEIEPNNAEVYYNLGIIHYKNDRTDDAVKNFITSKSLDPKFAPTYYQLGLAYVKKGEINKAIQNLEMFLEKDPDSPQASQVRIILDSLKKQI